MTNLTLRHTGKSAGRAAAAAGQPDRQGKGRTLHPIVDVKVKKPKHSGAALLFSLVEGEACELCS